MKRFNDRYYSTIIFIIIIVLFHQMIATNQSSSFENESNNQNDIIDQSNHFELKEQQQIDNSSSSSSSSNESGKISENSTTTSSSSINARYNCTPVDRNETAKLIVVNSSSIPSYIQLKNYFIVDLFYLNHSNNDDNGGGGGGGNPDASSTDNNETTTTTTESIEMNNTTASTNETSGQCSIMIFYYNWCRFSSAAAPKFNAIGRLYPQMYIMAIDAYYHYSITIRFGVSGVPSIYFLYNGRAVAKYNRTDITMDGLHEFIHSLTSLEPIQPNITDNNYEDSDNEDNNQNEENENKTSNTKQYWKNITENDLNGPLVISMENQQNYLLIFCWKFCLIVLFYHFFRSNLFTKIKDHVRSMWNEWAQTVQHHEHTD
uniref:Thioredoxin domain-containing protein 15-like n=1 Tax=Dermatophagoides pteronyssinus TaxID=6956 RepID=A0A6P6YC09_DERPT|nr:thioredoxin domain-containing protein 15-like [Dermatophagoides pteronyssinus]